MKESTETLSDKILHFRTEHPMWEQKMIDIEDVKEFIRKLKANLNSVNIEIKYDTLIYLRDKIDELAGEKLIDSPHSDVESSKEQVLGRRSELRVSRSTSDRTGSSPVRADIKFENDELAEKYRRGEA